MTIFSPASPPAGAPAARHLQIDVWSDLACPWCYLAKHRLDQAIAASPHADAITVVLHSFELDPAMPPEAKPNLEVLSAGHHLSPAQARGLEDRMAALARREGLPFTPDRMLANSFDVHRVLHLAATYGLADQLLGLLQRALFSGQADVYDHAVLADTASRLGIPRDRAEEVLRGEQYADAVRADEAEARRLGVTGVPFTVFGGRTAIPGATSLKGYADAIEKAWSQL